MCVQAHWVRMGTYILYKRVKKLVLHRVFRMWVMSLLMMVCADCFAEIAPAGTTMDRATRVSDTVSLSVQSGGNFVRLEAKGMPATVTYFAPSAFGPIPEALVSDQLLEATMFFDNCTMGWKWELAESESAKIIEIRVHENAVIRVEPTVSFVHDTVAESACDKYEYEGKEYTESCEFIKDTVLLPTGDRQINHVVLTIGKSTTFEQIIDIYEPYEIGDKTYSETMDVNDTLFGANAAGCDSIIIYHLIWHETTIEEAIEETACDEWKFNGHTYTESKKFNDTLITEAGDRIITPVDLTINHSTSSIVTETAIGSYTSGLGNVYDKTGIYTEKTTNVAGCDSIITLDLTIIVEHLDYDTVYFCKGFNVEHDERIDDENARRFLPYTFESPAEHWAEFMEDVLVEREPTSVLVDLNTAEKNMRAFYTKGLTPIETIAWSVLNLGAKVYERIIVEEAPQRIANGTLAVQIRFRCGEVFNTEYPLAIDAIEASMAKPVKRIENGQLVILRGGEKYTITGTKIR